MESGDLLRDAFGLNSYEVKLYVALLARAMKPGDAAQASGVPLPRTYDTLRSLEQKGFVVESEGAFRSVGPSVALRSKIARYSSQFDSDQAARRAALKKIVAERGPHAGPAAPEAEPAMLKGLDSISAAFLEVLRSSKEVYLLVRKGLKARGAFIGLLREEGGKAKGVKLMLSAHQAVPREELEEAEALGLEVRYAEGVLLDMMAGDGGGVIIGVPARGSDESFSAVAIWIQSKAFAASVLESLASQWKGARRA